MAVSVPLAISRDGCRGIIADREPNRTIVCFFPSSNVQPRPLSSAYG